MNMEVLWNQVNLQRPPYRSWDISIKKFDPKQFIGTIDNILNDFKTFQILHMEAALLSRLIYRMKRKFRSDKGLKYMEKVNRALLNYLNMSIEREYELLKEYIEINNGIISLPPRQTLEYVLVRTQGFAKLMSRVETTAMTAGNFLKSRLHIGQSWALAMIAYAVISRIWILSRHILKQSCNWYNSIFKYVQNFKTIGIQWLPDNYILPQNLSEWLNLPWFNEDLEKLPVQENWEKSIFNFINTNDIDDEELGIVNDMVDKKSKKTLECVYNDSKLISEQISSDLGDRISRHSYQEANVQDETKILDKVQKVKKKKKNNKNIKKLLNVESEKDLVRLLQIESFPGLDKLQFKILQKRIKKFVMKVTKNNTCDLNDKRLELIRRKLKKWIC